MKKNRIPNIPNQNKKQPLSQHQQHGIIKHEQLYQGPIPEAGELQRYEDIQPGFAHRIIAMAEKEQEHRISINREASQNLYSIETGKQRITKRGQWFALVSMALVLLFASYLAYLGNTSAAAWVVGGVIIGIVALFVTGKNVGDKR